MRQYCAFWFPTIFHQTDVKVVRARDAVLKIPISDNVKKSADELFLDVRKQADDGLVFTTYCILKDGTQKNKHELELKFEEKSNNGFVVYSYDDEGVKSHDYLFRHVFYHHAKSLYHDHEISHDSDAGLEALSSDMVEFVPKDIFRQNNPIIRYYLKQYEALFAEHYAFDLSAKNRFYGKVLRIFDAIQKYHTKKKSLSKKNLDNLEDELDRIREEISSYNGEIKVPFVYDALTQKARCEKKIKNLLRLQGQICRALVKDIIVICDNARMEYTYCKTLLESKYNTQIKHNVSFDNQEIYKISHKPRNDRSKDKLAQIDESRKIANNIRNSIRYIENIKGKCVYRAYELVDNKLEVADKFSRRSQRLAWALGLITIVSFVIELPGIIEKVVRFFSVVFCK